MVPMFHTYSTNTFTNAGIQYSIAVSDTGKLVRGNCSGSSSIQSMARL